MNKQELFEKALSEFDEWPYDECSMIYCHTTYMRYQQGVFSSFDEKSDCDLNHDNWLFICTREEFEAEKAKRSKKYWDGNGEYYQQKIVYGGDGTGIPSEKDYMTVGGKRLNFIPAEIVCDEELPVGSLPRQLGYLYGISEKVLARYRVSADYKEAQKALLPTTYTKGWRTGDGEVFEELNNRKNIESGPYSVNALPNNVEVSVESTQADMEDFHWYFDASKKQVSEMGGKAGATASNMTATEADIVASAQNALLNTIADNAEESFMRVCAFCAMLEGLVLPDDVNNYDDVVIEMPRDFATPKLTVEEVKVLFEAYQSGVRTRDQIVRAMANGGWDSQSAEETLAELENDGGVNLPQVGDT